MSSVDPRCGWGASLWVSAQAQPEQPSGTMSNGDLPDADLVSVVR